MCHVGYQTFFCVTRGNGRMTQFMHDHGSEAHLGPRENLTRGHGLRRGRTLLGFLG